MKILQFEGDKIKDINSRVSVNFYLTSKEVKNISKLKKFIDKEPCDMYLLELNQLTKKVSFSKVISDSPITILDDTETDLKPKDFYQILAKF